MAAYATPADLSARYDLNEIKDLASDTGTPVSDISADTNVLTALNSASGRVEAACFVSGIYDADTLAALTGNSQAFLKEIVCEIAIMLLMGRRPGKYGSEAVKELLERTETWLDALRSGKNLFNVAQNVEAGLPSVDGPSSVDYDRMNLIQSRTPRFYPGVATRLPIGRG